MFSAKPTGVNFESDRPNFAMACAFAFPFASSFPSVPIMLPMLLIASLMRDRPGASISYHVDFSPFSAAEM